MFRSSFQKFAVIVFLFVFLAVQTPVSALSIPEISISGAPSTVLMAAPGPFGKATPSNNATGQARDITLTWGASSGAAKYEYCYDTAATGACTGPWNFAGLSTSASFTITLPGTTFYWQVRAVSSTSEYTYADGSDMAKWRFDLFPEPGAFNKTLPANLATGQPVNGLVLTWTASDNASGYEYCLNTTGPSCTGSWTPTNSQIPTFTLNNLTPGATYYWQVQAVNPSKTVVASNGWWSFTVAPAPGAFTKTAPVVDATGQSTSPTLSWGTSTNATQYEYCTSASAACTSNLWLGTGTTRTVTITGLTPGTTTYWQVRAKNPSGTVEADGGVWRKFTTAPLPGIFDKLTPLNGAIDQPISGLKLTWETSANATKYEYCYDTALAGACTGTWINAGTSLTATISATLLPDTVYRWQVRASTINGVEYASGLDTAVYTFRTLPPPVAFSKTAPGNPSTGLTNNGLVLSWGPSSAGVSYEYCVNTSASCADTAWVTTNAATTVTLTTPLTPGATYYWQVRARNGSGTVYADGGTFWSFTTRLTPDDFSKTAPANTAIDRVINSLTLSWGASGNAASYEYCLNTTGLSCAEPWPSTGTSRTVTRSGLTPGTVYFWQVRARNANGLTYANAAVWWSFTTLPVPGAFTKNPTETYFPADNHWVIQWSASAKAASYEYCVSTTSGTCPNNVWSPNGTALTASLPGLTAGTTYYWQVRARNTSGTTDADGGTWETFTTTSLPGAFGKTAPASGSTAQELNNLQLSWGASAGATSYEYCVSTSSSCANGVWTTSASPATLNGLLPGVTYYWQVRARNSISGATEADAGTWWSFTTKAYPGPFKKSTPANNAVDQLITNLALSWSASGNAASYEYCFNITPSCPSTSWKSTGTALNATVTSGLNPGTVYYWQVRARNSFGDTYADDNVWWTFTTRPLPGAFAKTAPTKGITGQPINGIVLKWGASTNFDSYEYCLSTTSAACPNDTWTPNGTSMTATLSNLQAGVTYYWQARARNTNGYTYANDDNNAATIDWWTFTTLAAPGAFSKTAPGNTAVGQATTGLVLTWGNSSSATSYEYCVSATATCPGDVWTTATSPATYPTTLTAGTKYYWQVRARNINGLTMANNAWWSFTTLQKPGAFNKSAPATTSTNQPINGLALSWDASTNTSGYQYCYSSTSAACPSNNWIDAGTALTVTIGSLAPNTTYYWQVRAWNVYDSTEANGGTWWTFTTQSQAGAFTKTAPTNGATGQPVTGLALSWGASSGATAYAYCMNTTGPTCPNNNWTTTGASQSVTLSTTLQANTTYYWQARASNSTGTVESSGGWWTFTTSQQLPGAFNKSAPANLATGQPVNGLTISWGASANATGYEYCYNTTASCPTNGWTPVGTATSATLPALTTATPYYWQVRANGANRTTYANNGTWWSFTTQAAGGAFSKSTPVTGATGQPTSGLVLNWGASANATGYEYCLNTSASCTTWTPTGTNRSVTRDGLLVNTTYYWHVRALNGAITTYSEGSATAFWSFTTQGSSKVYLPIVQAPPPIYAISGKVTLDGAGLAGVTITTNDGKTSTTDASGNYTFNLYAGSYTLTPTLSGYTFTPTSRAVTTPPAATGVNFTATQDCTELIKDGGFESRNVWELPPTQYTAGYTSNIARTGTWSLRTGIESNNDNRYSYSSGYQVVTLPSTLNSATLKFWLYPFSGEPTNLALPDLPVGLTPQEAYKADQALNAMMYNDAQNVLILNSGGNVVDSLVHQVSDAREWQGSTFDLSGYAGQTIQIYFDTYNDGVGGVTGMYIDDVSLKICK